MKKHIITLSGDIGSGKSTTSKLLCEALSYDYFYSGNIMRELAMQAGMTFTEFTEKALFDPTIDKLVDKKVQEAGLVERRIIDSRLAFHWIPDSFKVYITLPLEIAARRILKDLENNTKRAGEFSYTEDEMFQKISRRRKADNTRYMQYYGIDTENLDSYDFIVSSEHLNKELVRDTILKEYNDWLSS